MDESRLGLKTVVRRRLTLCGTKPVGPLQWRFEAFYLYGAVEPATGESFFLAFSHLDSTCFQVFLERLAQHYPNQFHLLQLDNASAHTATSLRIPENLILFFQPPHSPEVNPIERLWQHLKNQLSWLSFAHLDALREVISERLHELTPAVVASLTGYDFILGALKQANII